MRLDVVSIFPDYLAPLRLSLVGKAQAAGLLDVRVHDLRLWTHDRHRTVDDTPYGGGAGMVMRPEPWGEALDELTTGEEATPVLVVPTPSGERLTQAVAEELSAERWLLFACGRYEGIDERVLDHARGRMPVREISVGDYVLNGGEVAALVVVEAVVRLLPGFMGNPRSLSEESHATAGGGLLEYPVYTRPPSWRGLDVPEVLLSGHHGEVARWRHTQALRRTAERRPDLLHPSLTLTLETLPDVAEVRVARPSDAPEILVLQRACWVPEGRATGTFEIPPLTETAADVARSLGDWTTVVVRVGGRLVGSVRTRHDGTTWDIGRLMVAPDLQGRGLGRWLLEYAEEAAPPGVRCFTVCTEVRGEGDLRMYRRAGYRPMPGVDATVVRLSKQRR